MTKKRYARGYPVNYCSGYEILFFGTRNCIYGIRKEGLKSYEESKKNIMKHFQALVEISITGYSSMCMYDANDM